MKKIHSIPLACTAALFALAACKPAEKELLTPKVYMEEAEQKVEIGDGQNDAVYTVHARQSTITTDATQVNFELADSSFVSRYNQRFGTEYAAFPLEHASLQDKNATIPAGAVYSDNKELHITNLSSIAEGKSYLLPIIIKSASKPIIASTDVTYFILSKPVRIKKVWQLTNDYLTIPFSPQKPFKSITYEALINPESFGSNNTVMGQEGRLILRIGDVGGGLDRDLIQIAGNKQFNSTQRFTTGKWYHVAFTYDQSTGKAIIYINGKKSAESQWDTPEFALGAETGFHVGKVKGFMWGERPFLGSMSEVRVWSVARTANQIAQNMLNINPKSEGLAAYYKLNGSDRIEKDGKVYVKDASGNGLDAEISNNYQVQELKEPVSVN